MSNPGPATTVTGNAQPLNSSQAIRLLGVVKGVNLNATGDTPVQIICSTTFSVSNVILTNASISLTNALAGVFTAPAAGGTAIVANAALSAATGPTIVSQRTVASTAALTNVPNLFVNVGTAQGAAATADIYIYGYDFSPV
jgi:hypothetical protein